jgi:DNA-binding transcriptional LysR family regulator
MDRFAEMKVFTAVADAGSFVAAADALGMSKAAVSRHVNDLEARLGVRLMQRTTRRLSLTEEGQVFQARSRELLAGVDEAEAEVSARTATATGLLRISAPVTFGILHLAPLWGQFRAKHPQVAFDITLSDRTADLVEEGFDMAVRIATLPNSSLVSRRLASTRLVACASPAYLRRHGKPREPADLKAHEVIAYSYWSGGDEWAFDGAEGRVAVTTRPCMRTNNGDTCRAAALAGQGIVLQPTFLIGDDLAAGKLVEVMPRYRAIELGIYAVVPSRKHLATKTRKLIAFLVDAFAKAPWSA